MEPLIEKNNLIQERIKPTVDRVTITKEESEKLSRWLEQLKSETSGFLDVSKSDLVNFLIHNHAPALSKKEIKELRALKYDLVRHLNWLTPLLKKAIEDNDQEKIILLQAELKNIEIKTGSKNATNELMQIKPRKRRIKKSDDVSIEYKNESIQLEK